MKVRDWNRVKQDTLNFYNDVEAVIAAWNTSNAKWNVKVSFENYPPRLVVVAEKKNARLLREAHLVTLGELAANICGLGLQCRNHYKEGVTVTYNFHVDYRKY